MQSKAATVAAYLAELPHDRRAAIEKVREVFKTNVDKDIEEGMTYGMIGYYIPHRVFPAGYHCDPKMPLPYGGLASQKKHMSLYLMSLYMGGVSGRNPLVEWFITAWAKTGKKLDMGKSCIRFKKIEDLALDVIAEAIRRVTSKSFIEVYQRALATHVSAKPVKKAPAKPAAKPATKKVVKKAAKKKTTKKH